jgi:hypothetical protein
VVTSEMHASLAAESGWQTIICRGGPIHVDPDSITYGHAICGCACGPSFPARRGASFPARARQLSFASAAARAAGGLPGPQPHLRLADAVGTERGEFKAQPQAAVI